LVFLGERRDISWLQAPPDAGKIATINGLDIARPLLIFSPLSVEFLSCRIGYERSREEGRERRKTIAAVGAGKRGCGQTAFVDNQPVLPNDA